MHDFRFSLADAFHQKRDFVVGPVLNRLLTSNGTEFVPLSRPLARFLRAHFDPRNQTTRNLKPQLGIPPSGRHRARERAFCALSRWCRPIETNSPSSVVTPSPRLSFATSWPIEEALFQDSLGIRQSEWHVEFICWCSSAILARVASTAVGAKREQTRVC